ncbi:peptidyl-prolyl cis-trans isomerase [bacterium]|nr:peptidyl-prolyl cis-trans isomerase [bacterium]
MKTSVIIAAAGAALLLSAGTAFPRVIDGVVALVNEEPVTFSEVRESVSEGMGIPVGDADALLREERDPRAVLRWIEALVDSVLVRKELEKLGQPITEAEIDRAVDSVRKANGMSEAQFTELLGKEGITVPAYRRRIRWQMERGAIVRARKFKEVTVTESEVRDYFRESEERFLVGAQVRLETLFFPIASPPSAGEDPAQARIAVQQAAEAVRAGRTFAEAEALVRGTFPGTQLHDAGFVTTEDLLPELQREVRRLRAGESSPPFFTEGGAYLLRVVERRGGTPGDFSAAKEGLTEELTDRRSEKAYTDILSELKRAASIDVRL